MAAHSVSFSKFGQWDKWDEKEQGNVFQNFSWLLANR
jgi:hypothetical protein